MFIFLDLKKTHDITSRKATSQNVQYTTAVHWKSATAMITSCAWSLGCFRGMGSFHVCFIIPSSGVIYGSHTGHSSELFISAEDKKENHGFITQTELACLHSRQASLDSCITHTHTHLICLYRGNKVSHVCRASLNRADMWWIQNGICWNTNSMSLLLLLTICILMTHILKKRKKNIQLCLDCY